MRKLLSVLLVSSFFLSLAPVASAVNASETVIYRVERSYELTNNSSSTAEGTELVFYAFDNRGGWASQHIISETIAPEFQEKILSNKDNRVVRVNLGKIGPYETKSVTATYLIRVDSVDLDINPSDVTGDVPSQYSQYTEPVPNLWQSDDPQIKSKAEELTENVSNYYSKVKNIVDFVSDHLSYEVQSIEHGAIWALNHNVGDCTEFSNLFIALCRASGIPANVVSGYLPYTEVYGRTVNKLSKVAHQWAIVYLPSVGWTPVDLTYFLDDPQFGELANNHIVQLTSGGGNWVGDSSISVPNVSWSYTYFGDHPNLEFRGSGTVNKEVAAKMNVQSSVKKYSENVEVAVKVMNQGAEDLKNLGVELISDNEYFETPPSKEIQILESGKYEMFRFELPKKKSAENESIRVLTTYETDEFGKFKSSEEFYVSTTVETQEPSPDSEKGVRDFIRKHFFILITLIVAILAGLVFLAVR